jgi:hypothetical protein
LVQTDYLWPVRAPSGARAGQWRFSAWCGPGHAKHERRISHRNSTLDLSRTVLSPNRNQVETSSNAQPWRGHAPGESRDERFAAGGDGDSEWADQTTSYAVGAVLLLIGTIVIVGSLILDEFAQRDARHDRRRVRRLARRRVRVAVGRNASRSSTACPRLRSARPRAFLRVPSCDLGGVAFVAVAHFAVGDSPFEVSVVFVDFGGCDDVEPA